MTKLSRHALPLGLFVALLALLAAALLRPAPAGSEAPPSSALVGKPAPGFDLARLDATDGRVKRDDLLGKPWLLNVWASWCTNCAQEHPVLLALARSTNAPIVGLDHRDAQDAARDWLTRRGNPYTATLVDADGRIGAAFGVQGVPQTFVIDRTGVVRYAHVGQLTDEIVRTRVLPLLGQR